MTLTSSHNGTSRKDPRAGAAEGLRRMAADLLARSTVQVIESTSSVSVDPGEIGAVEVSAGELIVEPREPDDDRSEAVEDSGDTVAVVDEPPYVAALVLRDHLPEHLGVSPQLLRAGSPLVGMVGYTWYSEDNFNKAHRWCLGLIAAAKAGMPTAFFVDAIVDLYHFDRALRARANSTAGKAPVRRTDIPHSLPGNSMYTLKVMPVSWSPKVPDRATDAVADFLQRVTPDNLWIAEYTRSPALKNDPIIYATFGPWEVELVRWD
jgi:hypothetical protein